MRTGTFRSFDKAELFYREWEPTQEANGKVVLLLHRGHEHSEKERGTRAKEMYKTKAL